MKILAATILLASHEPLCATYQDVVSALGVTLKQAIHAEGVSVDGFLVTWWGSEETGSWTITITGADGITCVASFGRYFEKSNPPQGEEG